MKKISKTDLLLLRELQKNARITNKTLSERLKVSSVTVSNHISKLEKAGYIQKYVAVLNPDKFGLTIESAIEVSVAGGHIVDVEEKLAQAPNVYAVYDVTGETDVLLLARFETRDELSQFVKNLLGMPYVLRTNTRLILTTVKRGLEIPLPDSDEK